MICDAGTSVGFAANRNLLESPVETMTGNPPVAVTVPDSVTCIPVPLLATLVSRLFPTVTAGSVQPIALTKAVTWFWFPAGALKPAGTPAVRFVVV